MLSSSIGRIPSSSTSLSFKSLGLASSSSRKLSSSFTFQPQRTKVLFGVEAEDAIAAETNTLGSERVLVLSTGGSQKDKAVKISESLQSHGCTTVGVFAQAKMHVPIETTEQALEVMNELKADTIVSLGGGSSIGLGKALCLRTGARHVCVPTTYSGSEMTPILGETKEGRKITIRKPEILPDTVIYDPKLTLGLPVPITVLSAFNAIAHAMEGLYAHDKNPVGSALAREGISGFAKSLPVLIKDPNNYEARAQALQAAWACGTCLGQVSMGLHHKLCHTLGGSFDLPHAETHTLLLPYVTSFNASHASSELAAVTEGLGAPIGTDPGTALFDFFHSLGVEGVPSSLRELGLSQDAVKEAATIAMERPCANPRAFAREDVESILEDAWHGRRPAGENQADGPLYFSEERSVEVVTSRHVNAKDPRLAHVVNSLVRHAHGFVKDVQLTEDEWMMGIKFLTATGHMCNDWRQEFILLSDCLGISMLVDAINHKTATNVGASESTVLGPFHLEGAPKYEMGANICQDAKGEPMFVSGQITDTNGNPIEGASIDVWQANDDGFYDVQQQGIQPEHNLRGMFTTGADGQYSFRSVKPKFYPIPHDGPVGKLMEDLGRGCMRPAHLHYIVKAKGYKPLVTHIFDPACPYVTEDCVFGVKESLLANFTTVTDGEAVKELGCEGPLAHEVVHDFVLCPAES